MDSVFVTIFNKFKKPLSPKELPTNEYQVGHICSTHLPIIMGNQKQSLTTNIIQDLATLILPCQGVWMITMRFSILNPAMIENLVNSLDSTLSFQNVYVTNEDIIGASAILSYGNSKSITLSPGESFSVNITNVYVATNDLLTLKINSSFNFTNNLLMVSTGASDLSLLNDYVLQAVRIV